MHRSVLGHNFACYKDGFKCICVSGQPYVPKPEFVNMSNYPGHRPECFIYDGKCYCESSSPWLIRPIIHDGKELSPQEVIQLYRSNLLPLTSNHLGKPSDKTYPYQSQKIDQETSLKCETLQKPRLTSTHPFVQHTQPRRERFLYLQSEVGTAQKVIESGKQETAELLEQKSQLSTEQSAAQPARSSTEQSVIHQPKECSVQSEVQQTKLIAEQLEPQTYQPDTEQLSREQSQQSTQAVMQQSCLEIARPKIDLKKHPEKLLRHVPLRVLQRALENDVRSKWEQRLQQGHVISVPYKANLKYNFDDEEQVTAESTKDERVTDKNVLSERLPKVSSPKNAIDKIQTTHEFGQVLTPRNKHMHCNLEFPNWTLLYPYVMQYPEAFIKNPQQLINLSKWHTANMLSHFHPHIMNHELVGTAISWQQNISPQEIGTYQPYTQIVQLPWQHSY